MKKKKLHQTHESTVYIAIIFSMLGGVIIGSFFETKLILKLENYITLLGAVVAAFIAWVAMTIQNNNRWLAYKKLAIDSYKEMNLLVEKLSQWVHSIALSGKANPEVEKNIITNSFINALKNTHYPQKEMNYLLFHMDVHKYSRREEIKEINQQIQAFLYLLNNSNESEFYIGNGKHQELVKLTNQLKLLKEILGSNINEWFDLE